VNSLTSESFDPSKLYTTHFGRDSGMVFPKCNIENIPEGLNGSNEVVHIDLDLYESPIAPVP
jgi:hypothetical protein